MSCIINISNGDGIMAEKLLGDITAEFLRKIRADRVANAIARITKKPCGCAKRQAKLNELHEKYRTVQARNQAQRNKELVETNK